MKAAFFKLKADLAACQSLENRLRGKQKAKKNLVVEKKLRYKKIFQLKVEKLHTCFYNILSKNLKRGEEREL